MKREGRFGPLFLIVILFSHTRLFFLLLLRDMQNSHILTIRLLRFGRKVEA